MKEWLNFLVLLFEPSLLMSTNCDNVVFKAALSFLMFWRTDNFVKLPSRAIRRCFADRDAMKANLQNHRADFHDLFRILTRTRFLILHGGITITAFSKESRGESPFRKRLWKKQILRADTWRLMLTKIESKHFEKERNWTCEYCRADAGAVCFE